MSLQSGYGEELINAEELHELVIEGLGPSFVGWLLLVFVSGMCVRGASPHLFAKPDGTSRTSRKSRWVLGTVMFLLFGILGLTVQEVLRWGTIVYRTVDQVYDFTKIDCIITIPAGLITFIVQGFFAERAWKVVRKSIIFLILVLACMALALAGAVGVAVLSLMSLQNDTYTDEYYTMTEVWLVASAATDTIICLVLAISLVRQRVGFSTSTDGLLLKLTRVCFETAAMPTIFAISAAAVNAATFASKGQAVYWAFAYPLPAIYAFSLLWTLDSTAAIRRDASGMSASCHKCQHEYPTSRPGLAEMSFRGTSLMPPATRTQSRSRSRHNAGSLQLVDLGGALALPSRAAVTRSGTGKKTIAEDALEHGVHLQTFAKGIYVDVEQKRIVSEEREHEDEDDKRSWISGGKQESPSMV